MVINEALMTHSLDKLHYIGTRPLDEVTRKYGLTRPLPEEAIRHSYQKYFPVLIQVLSQGRKLDMVASYGSWGYPTEAGLRSATFPPEPPSYNYKPTKPTRSRMRTLLRWMHPGEVSEFEITHYAGYVLGTSEWKIYALLRNVARPGS